RNARASRDRARARAADLPRASGEDQAEVAPRHGDAGAARHLNGLLALFDLDGTLFLTPDPVSAAPVRRPLEGGYGPEGAADAPDNVEHRGLSAQRIARNVLRAAGLGDREIDDRLPSWCSNFAERYLELLAAADTSAWEARPDASDGLARLEEAGV